MNLENELQDAAELQTETEARLESRVKEAEELARIDRVKLESTDLGAKEVQIRADRAFAAKKKVESKPNPRPDPNPNPKPNPKVEKDLDLCERLVKEKTRDIKSLETKLAETIEKDRDSHQPGI